MDNLKTFDAYAKTQEEYRVRTRTGALITIICFGSIILLLLSEYLQFTQVKHHQELVVDHSRRQRLTIHFNITFPQLPCSFVSMDVMDVSGEQQNELHTSIFKVRLDPMGLPLIVQKNPVSSKDKEISKFCGDCYGASHGCCNSCDEVLFAYRQKDWTVKSLGDFEQCIREGRGQKLDFDSKEGCRMHGHFEVNKVQGNFHFAPGHGFQHANLHIHDVQAFAGHFQDLRFGHIIHDLRFGDWYEGISSPLTQWERGLPDSSSGQQPPTNFQYFIKVVPTEIYYLNQSRLTTNQYSVTQYEKLVAGQQQQMPGIFFNYDISPMMVIYREEQKPFSSFLTDVCAIIGGIFAISAFTDQFLYSAERAWKHKVQLGKTA